MLIGAKTRRLHCGKYIPYGKLFKEEKRQTRGDLNPSARKPKNSKAYNRMRTQDWKTEHPDLRPLFYC